MCILIYMFSKLCTQEIKDLCCCLIICSCAHFFEFENSLSLAWTKKALIAINMLL
jgi:hypothetical protein